jgi:hypothetical protein
MGAVIPITNEKAVGHANAHAVCSILDLCFMKDKDQVRNLRTRVPTGDVGLVYFFLSEKKLVLDDNLPPFIMRSKLGDAPPGITMVSKKIEVVDLEERALIVRIRRSKRNIEIAMLGDVNHSPKLACGGILANGDGNKVSNTDEEGNIVAEHAQWGCRGADIMPANRRHCRLLLPCKVGFSGKMG